MNHNNTNNNTRTPSKTIDDLVREVGKLGPDDLIQFGMRLGSSIRSGLIVRLSIISEEEADQDELRLRSWERATFSVPEDG